MSTAEEIKNEYTSSLADLTFNSKPLINMLTMLAEENLPNAKVIVEAIETHLSKVATDVKLPVLYLIDCIVKNVGRTYTVLFSQNIVPIFCSVFKVVDEKTRAEMFKLRQTWNDVFPQLKLYAIDVQISLLDPAWPVTAQPSNSIHFNPKFLKSTTTPATLPLKANTDSTQIITPGPGSIDKETLLMQEKLLQKQKELLELQQRKLELEVLQTQVKLQEQMKGNVNPPLAPNILLKPEVAKQLIPPASNSTKSKPPGIASSVMNQRLQNNTNNQSRINPVSGALVSAVRPIRDPRLLRQQQQQPKAAINQSNNADGQVVQNSAILENNKNVTNKLGVRDIRKDPRLTNKNNTNKPKTFPKSRNQFDTEPKHIKRAIEVRSSPKTSLDSEKSISSKSSSSSSLDSPTKIKIEKPPKSPIKNRKKEKNDEKILKDLQSEKPQKSGSPTNFKGTKIVTIKNRNYMRRNTPGSSVPPQDEDLRSLGPPEKQARLQCDSTDDKVIANESSPIPASKDMDVDLRQLPAVISKKRSSIESSDVNTAKKSKTEMFDVLFGNEDTDLRQLPVNTPDRPPTPPPPIISSSEVITTENTKSPKKSSNLDAIRAKLANATNWEKAKEEKSFNKNKILKSSLADQDLRPPTVSSSTDIRNSIIISPDDEKSIKSGAMTKEQQTQLLNKIFMQIEKDKLREAKKKDHEDSIGNISLQPISDDEFEDIDNDNVAIIDSPKDKDERLRSPHLHIQNEEPQLQTQSEEPLQHPQPPLFYPRNIRRHPGAGPWRGNANWHGRGGRMGRDNQQMMPVHRPPIRPWMQQTAWRNYPPQQPDFSHMPPQQPDITAIQAEEEIDIAGDQLTNGAIVQDEIKTINIDGIPRDIRYYGDTAIVFLNWDDPREVSFQSGIRRVIFNDHEVYALSFGDNYKECLIDGVPHKIKLGVPSREIIIDDIPYECYFGGAGICVDLNGVNVSVKLDGPVPQVKIGDMKRTDLVAGKINLIINAKIIVPVFLDAKVQKFVIDGETSTLKFVDALQTVLINDVPFNVEFGGLPKPFTVHDKKHFIRFSVLPKGVKPGHVRIKDMEGQTSFSPKYDDSTQDSSSGFPTVDTNEPALPVIGKMKRAVGTESPDARSNSPNFFQNLLQPSLNNLDVLSNVLSSSMVPTTPSSEVGYQIENIPQNSEVLEKESPLAAPPVPPALNINELFQKLVASGFVKTGQNKSPNPPSESTFEPSQQENNTKDIANKVNKVEPQNAVKSFKRNLLENMKFVTFAKPSTLKLRQGSLYVALYTGMQCSSCGMRFPPEASMQYSQHLDWHFRQNRRGKRNIRVASSRKWYYSLADWKNYEEIEDLEEREKNYFDQQQQQAEVAAEDAEDDAESSSVPADPERTDECCEVCRDKFDQFFNEEKEEWHLKNATKVDEKTYHPLCYKDYQKSLAEQSLVESNLDKIVDEQNTEEASIPGLEIILDDDDELPHSPSDQPEIVSLESDESKSPTEKSIEEPPEPEADEDDDDDDDVILNEVAPVKIVVDDDEDDQENEDKQKIDQPVKVKKEKHVDDDGFVDVGEGLVSLNKVGQIKIKSEPMDSDERLLPNEETTEQSKSLESEISVVEPEEVVTSHPELITSMDGNIELVSSAPVSVPTTGVSGNKIKINISKPLPVISQKDKDSECSEPNLEPSIDPTEVCSPLEEPKITNFKDSLKDVELKKMPPVRKGTELTGLCSIM